MLPLSDRRASLDGLGFIGCAKEDANNSIDVREVDRDTLEPILFLLQSPDIEVQRAASAALGNLAVNSRSNILTFAALLVSDCLQRKTRSPLYSSVDLHLSFAR